MRVARALGVLCVACVGLWGESGYVMSHVGNLRAHVNSLEITKEETRTMVRLLGSDGHEVAVIDVTVPSAPKVKIGEAAVRPVKNRRAASLGEVGATADDTSRELRYVVGETDFWVVNYRDLDRERAQIVATQALYAP